MGAVTIISWRHPHYYANLLCQQKLHVEAEFDNIAFLHDVVFAFHADFAGGAAVVDGAVFHEVVVGDDFGLNEAFFEVTVNNASGLGCGISLVNGPGANFFFAGGEVGLQPQGAEAGAR